ncbi:LUD domain-containing protein [Gloeocapsa sp. PCC 73106]|uniref:LutC/YkgG family protein n=1 Tax=Gloeocapsa sp. PCC 73106 TaxID=102232 RepID=UPI0002AD1520|nr:LUD domain-containing protein [Gloeocapsa sp. PCC 73106]ELS00031.1 hypothetical protein GLO73106DRAFT_00038840 [Gloeocapsa sp. PCC 73106]
MTNSRDAILKSVSRNQPQGIPLPEIKLFLGDNGNLLDLFKQNLEKMGGSWVKIAADSELIEEIKALHPEAQVIASAVPEVIGAQIITKGVDPHSLAEVDVGVVRAKFGVAENGAVWLDQADLVVNALGFLSQHLVVILDSKELLSNMQAAYLRIDLNECDYGVFMAGPSATGDVEAVIVHGAQGPRSLTVFLKS